MTEVVFSRAKVWQRWLLWLPALTALVVYVRTLSRGAFPGESAWLVVQATGLSPRLYLDRPLWSMAIAALMRLPGNDFILKLNLFSAICGALGVYLCTRLTTGIIHRSIPEFLRRQHAGLTAMAALAGGISAGFFLAFTTPFWIAATRAHPATMHLAGLLAVAWLMFEYICRPGNGRLMLLAFLYGIGCVEFATFIVLAPAFGAYLLIFLWLSDLLNMRRMLLLAVAALAGLSFYLLAAWMGTRTAAFELREFSGFWHVLWVYWGGQYRSITRGLPQHGWMLMLTATVLPWTIGFLTIKRSLGGDRDTAFRILYLVLTALTVMVLFNHAITPWRLIGVRPLLVTPYLLSALLFGLLTANWMLWPLHITATAERGWKLRLQRFGGLVPAVVSLALVLWAPFRNLPAADGRPAGLVNRFSEQIVASAAGREWLVTDGSLDNHLLIAAHQTGRPLKLLNPSAINSPVYQRHLAASFDSLRLRGLLQTGSGAFMRAWLQTPGIEDLVAVLAMPDLWLMADCKVVPHGLVFLGVRGDDRLNPDELWSQNTVFWDNLKHLFESHAHLETPQWSRTVDQFSRHTGMVANNLGVLLEDLERPDLAWQAYRQARELDAGNISALLNLSLLARRRGLVPDEVESETMTALKRLERTLGQRRFQIRGLARTYGYVRMPQAFADMGWTWALSGNPGMAVAGLQRALSMSQNMPGAQTALAAVYLAHDMDVESESVYREILAKHPEHVQALIGMARVAMLRRQFDAAEEYVAAAEQSGAARTRIRFERAMLALLSGEEDAARRRLEDLVAEEPATARAWVLLAHIALRQDDARQLERIRTKLIPLAARDYAAAFVLGEIAMATGDAVRARQYFEQTLRMRPGNTHVLALLLQRDLTETRYDLAAEHVGKLLTIDPDHAFGNYVLGVLQLRNHQHSLAEASFRKSLEKQRTFYALTDLARVLIERGRVAEAEKLAREALKTAPDVPIATAVLGRALLRLQRYADAVEILDRAFLFSDRNPAIGIDLAEALMQAGDKDRALAVIDRLLGPDGMASGVHRDRLGALRRAIRQSSEP